MKKYWSFFRIRFLCGLQYRAAALAGIATQFAWGGMNVLLFWAFYNSDPSVFPMGFSQTSCYIWLQQAFMTLLFLWFLDNEIFENIRTGNIAYELARPMDLYNMWFVKNAAARLSRAVLRCLPILCVAAFLPYPYGLALPADMPAFVLFLATLFLGTILVVAFCMLIYIATFYTMSPMGLRMIILSFIRTVYRRADPAALFPGRPASGGRVFAFRGYAGPAAACLQRQSSWGGALDPARLASRVDRRAAGAGPGLDASGAAPRRRPGRMNAPCERRFFMRLYKKYLSIIVKSAMEYKASFFMTLLGQLLLSGTAVLAVYFLMARFRAVDGFTFGEVMLCFGTVYFSFGLARAVCARF